MPKPTDPIFSTPQNAALNALKAIGSGNTWGAFDVPLSEARLGHATRYVVPLWNYHRFGEDGRPDPTSKGLVQYPVDGSLWYQFRRPPLNASSQWKAQWSSLEICKEQAVPIIGVLKDRISGLCALALTFDGGTFMEGDDDDLWMELRPRSNVDLEVLQRHIKGANFLTLLQLGPQATALEGAGYFAPTDLADARARVLREVVQRRGQPAFRKQLLAAYGGRCAITGCDAEDALEAAHIIGYLGPQTQHVRNGLLLRADIHTLFDLDLVSICPERLQVVLAPALRVSTYAELHGRSLSLPSAPEQQPDRAALRHRWTGSRQSKASS